MTNASIFCTCLAEEFYPQVPAAVETVLGRMHIKTRRVRRAFCCGQAAFNEGMRDEAATLGRKLLAHCEPGAPIIVPSGSCASMIRIFYLDLFAGEPAMLEKVRAIRPWVFEFSEFLVRVLKVTDVGARFERAVAYHPSCHLMRELGLRDEPLRLLSAVRGIRLCELARRDECCGFGGLFSVKFPHISGAMLEDKLAAIKASGAEVVVANDPGCLMQIGGGAHRAGIKIETLHLAEVLASK
jgi:L-lactate dehydrogenase complex protein LldE